jgi:hypothetical protein
MNRLERIVTALLRVVPPPPAKVARPTGSFATLKKFQRIREKDSDTVWEVVYTDSMGAGLKELDGDATRRLEDRSWKETWERVRKPRAAKEDSR